MPILNCICIKWGTLYPTNYVNRLYHAVKRNTTRDVRFYCLTETAQGLDDGIEFRPLTLQPYETVMRKAQQSAPKKNGALRKIAMFNPSLFADIQGPVLALDLDVLITGNLDTLADYAPGHVCMRSAFSSNAQPRTYGEGSVIKFHPDTHGFLYEEMAQNPTAAVRFSQGSEQTYTSTHAYNRGVFTPYPKEWVASFKHHCRPTRPLNLFKSPKLPADARIVCFHGHPNIHEATHGYHSDPLHSTRKCQWIIDNWACPS